MSELESLKAGDATLEAEVITLDAKLRGLKADENAALTKMREIGKELRAKRSARAEIQRRIREAENPSPPVAPEVETIIQTVTATAQAAHAPPKREA